jgi:hypothetical protein
MECVREDKKMKKKILAGLLLAGSTMFAAPRVSFGIGFGAPAPVIAAVPPCPGPGYVFVNGYWRFAGGDRDWRDHDWRDNDRRDNDRRDNDRRAPEHFEHFDSHAEHFRR